MAAGQPRTVEVRPRTVATVCGVLLGIAAALWVIYLAQQVIVWMLVALFLALALNPAVELVERRLIHSRPAAVVLVFLLGLGAFAGLGFGFVPTVVDQVNSFVNAVPGYVEDLTHGRGSLGWLERDYHVVEKVQDAVNEGGATQLIGGAGTALAITKGVLTVVVAIITITFLTLFMLLEGPAWMESIYALAPPQSRQRWRELGAELSRIIGGYVSGNLLISLIAGTAATIVLLALDIPYAVALGLLVAILDLIPLAGATLAAILVTLVALTVSLGTAIVVFIFFVVYQQLENHLLQPLVYGRTVKISPLLALISVLIGVEVAGVLGALGAIPIAASLRAILLDWLKHRDRPAAAAVDGDQTASPLRT